MSNPIVCPFALGGINYKNGFVTSCPQQSDQLHLMSSRVIRPSEIINNDKLLVLEKFKDINNYIGVKILSG